MTERTRTVERVQPYDYIRTRYGVPAEVGGRITFRGRPGTIIRPRPSDPGHYLRIRLDESALSVLVHPRWEMTYEESS